MKRERKRRNSNEASESEAEATSPHPHPQKNNSKRIWKPIVKIYPKTNKLLPDSIKSAWKMNAEDVLEAPSAQTSKCVGKVIPKRAKIVPKMILSSSEMLQKWMRKRSWKHLHHKHPNSSEKVLQRDLKLLPKWSQVRTKRDKTRCKKLLCSKANF